MSAAIHAKTTKERATIAAAHMRRNGGFTRELANCFEMGDGDAVVRLLCAMANNGPKLKAVIRRYLSPESLKAGGLVDD